MNQAGVDSSQNVRREIWESFVSLLRSYAGAASLTGEPYTVFSFSNWATVEHQGRALRFYFRPDSGEAIWRSDLQRCGGFQINQDGTLGFPDGVKAIDMAAID